MRRLAALVLLSAALLAQSEPTEPTAVLQGLVTDVLDNPVPAARVTVVGADDGAVLASMASDGEGQWLLAHMPADKALALQVNAPGKAPRRVDLGLVAATSPLCLVLEDGEPLSGGVTADGAPVAGAWVVATSSDFAAITHTDGKGRYAFAAAPLRNVRVRAWHCGRPLAERAVNVLPHAGAGCDLVLRGEALPPRRLIAIGLPAAAAGAHFRVDADLVPLPAELRHLALGADGTALLERLPFPHEVEFVGAGLTAVPGSCRCGAYDRDDLEFRVHAVKAGAAPAVLVGRLDALGAATAGVRVVCRDRRGVQIGTATTRADGRFQLAVPRPPGSLLMLTVDPAANLRAAIDVTFDPVQEVLLAADAVASLAGTLRDAAGGAMAFAEVAIECADQRQRGSSRTGVIADRDGRFVAHSLPAGDCNATVRDHRGNLGTATVTLVSGETAELGPLTFAETGEIVGSVLDGGGKAQPGVIVSLAASNHGSSTAVRTDRDGRFRLHGVAAGECVLTLASDRGARLPAHGEVLVRAGVTATAELRLVR